MIYSLCGLGVELDGAHAALRSVPRARRADLRVTLGSPPPLPDDASEDEYFTEWDEHGRVSLVVARVHGGRYYRLVFIEGVVAFVDARGENVWATWSGDASEEDAIAFVLGAVLGFVLRLRGVACLHAAAVAIGDRAIALAGPSGTGKSSTAACFARMGYAVLTDDLAALCDDTGRIRVQPALPRVHVWPETARSLLGGSDALPRVTPRWDKRRLELDGRFQDKPLPLAAIYFLGARGAQPGAPTIEGMNPGAALVELVADSHATEFVSAPQRAREFDVLARLLRQAVPRRVIAGDGLAHVPELCRAIVRDFRAVA